ncbi:MAG: hypothetical protein ABWX92_15225 [Mycetocola sp.]
MAELASPEALEAFILRFLQDKSHSEQIMVLAEYQSDFLVLFGLIHRVRRLARAYILLRKQAFTTEGEVLVRAAMEHAVTAQYAFLTVGGIERLNNTLGQAQKKYAAVIAASSPSAELDAWAAALPDPTGPQLPPFSGAGIIGQLDTIKFLKTTYKVLSQTGHVSHESQTDAIIEVDGEYRLQPEPEPFFEHEVLYALTGFCLLAAWIIARLEGNTWEEARLQEFGVQLHVPWRLDTHLPAERRRFPNENT